MKKSAVFFLLAGVVFLASCAEKKKETVAAPVRGVKLGVEVFLESRVDLVKGKKVGLVTNPTGVDSQLRSVVELLHKNPAIDLVALYGPEHGIRGNAQAGEYVPFYFDEKYKLPAGPIPVFSLYGQSLKPAPDMFKNIDAYMRSFDTTSSGKSPEAEMIKNVEVLIFDIQDVGTRIYTYATTMAYVMQACAENGIDFIVLDRPDPINGVVMEGPILEYPEHSSFVGVYPVPVRYGMTVGELAGLYNDRFLEKKARLTVIPMQGWKRTMWYDETRLPWVIPSPNMPTVETATVYPGQVYLEGTNVSEGRGTTKPFEMFGATWIDGYELTRRLNSLNLTGIKFREAWFTPTFSKFAGELCGGAQIHVTDRNLYRPFETGLHIIKTIRDMYPNQFQFEAGYFDQLMGTAKVRELLIQGIGVSEIVAGFEKELADFAQLRKSYLLY